MTLLVKKVKAGLEDFSLGTGTEIQTRGDKSVAVTKVNAEWIYENVEQIKSADTTLIKFVQLLTTNTRKLFYYDAGSTLTPNDEDVLLPNSGTGRWLLRRGSSAGGGGGGGGADQTHDTEDDSSGSSHSGVEEGSVIYVEETNEYYEYTGTTDETKAGQWPAADGFYYDSDGKQFELYDPAELPIGIVRTANISYTFKDGDAAIRGGVTAVEFTSDSTITATIPADIDQNFPIGAIINMIQYGKGTINVQGGSGVAVTGAITSRGQYHAMSAVKLSNNDWVVIGGISEAQTQPVTIDLQNHTLSNDNALCSVILYTSGELLTIESAGGIEQPNEWCTPRVVNIGSNYEARLTRTAGNNINQGEPTGIWIPIDTSRGWGVQESGTTLNFVGTLEIRKIGSTTIEATCTLDLTSNYVA